MHLRDKFTGALLGTHVGDALGMPIEGYMPWTIQQQFGLVSNMLEARLGEGSYTDDTEMMIGIAESLIECKGFDGAHMARRFLENYHPERGYGSGTYQALYLLKNGISWQEAGHKVFSGGSFGNGSAMRIAPVGAFFYDEPQKLRAVAYASSGITHAHPLAQEAAALQAFAVANAIRADPEGEFNTSMFLGDLKSFLSPQRVEFRWKLEKIGDFLLGPTPSQEVVIEILGHDSTALNSVPTAIYAFLSHHSDFEAALIYAVNLGGDSDTIGAMTGAISGAFHGQKSIPHRWLSKLERKDYIEELGIRLWQCKHEICQ